MDHRRHALQGRVWLPMLGGVSGALLVLLVQAMSPDSAEAKSSTVVANQFILRDAENNARAKLSLHRGNPRLVFADKKGRPRLLLALEGEQPQLGLTDARGVVRALLVIDGYGPGLVLRDAQAHIRATMAIVGEGPHTGPRLSLFDPNHRLRVSLNAQLGDPSLIQALWPEGKGAAAAQAGPDGGRLTLHDAKGVESFRKP